MNPYAYAGGNPINFTDPTGLTTNPLETSQATASPSPMDAPTGGTSEAQKLLAQAAGNTGVVTDASQGLGLAAAGGVSSPEVLGGLTKTQVANIIFNEVRSLSGPGIEDAYYYMGLTIYNGAMRYEETGIPRPSMQPDVATVPDVENATYQRISAAVDKAYEARSVGIDPTGGAIFFNIRSNNSREPRQMSEGNPPVVLSTQSGPFNNSYPTKNYPATGIYVNTYYDEYVSRRLLKLKTTP